jgi:uncharacterized SAM-binding protein YcdF (DUF218 family)
MAALKWAIAILLGTGLTLVGAVIGLGFYLSPQDSLRSADVIVAVSGGETQQRTKEAVKLYNQGYAPKLLFSGAAEDKKGPSNAAVMRRAAIESGVPQEAIRIEENSVNTLQNAQFSASILKQMGAHRVILVTSPYHQRRASINFHKALGPQVEIINHSATDSSWRKNSWWTQPYTTGLTISELQKNLYTVSTKPEIAQ